MGGFGEGVREEKTAPRRVEAGTSAAGHMGNVFGSQRQNGWEGNGNGWEADYLLSLCPAVPAPGQSQPRFPRSEGWPRNPRLAGEAEAWQGKAAECS